MKDAKPIARTSEIVILEVENGETLVYDLRLNEAHCLNETAAFVWKKCDGENTVKDISHLLETQFKSPVTGDFVWLAVDQLQERGLLADGAPARGTGVSRREMIRRVGMASVIAAPIIASVIAPASAYASASCACVNPGACLTQTTCPSQVNCNASGVCAP
jgi:hypothetical protein